jgi:hypothetical protein
MAKFRIGNQELESDSFSWKLKRLDNYKSGKNKGKEYVTHERYFASLMQAIIAMQDAHLRDSDAASLEELRQELDAFRSRISSLFVLEARYER